MVFNAYGSNVYIQLGHKGEPLHEKFKSPSQCASTKAEGKDIEQEIVVDSQESGSQRTLQVPLRQMNLVGSDHRKRRERAKVSASSQRNPLEKKERQAVEEMRGERMREDDNDVIILSSSDEEDTKKPALGNGKKRPARSAKQMASKKTKKDIFDDSSSRE